ncbi:unnamed protein product, partial [Brenthis ino]
MIQTPDNVRQALLELLPQSVFNEVACFIFYDNHPRDQRPIDITVFTHKGEVQEFYQRELVDSILIENINNVTEITTLRNIRCDLFYLVVAKNEIVILSKKGGLHLHCRVSNVERYTIEEPSCKGLKIYCNDDAVPMTFDEDLNRLGDTELILTQAQSEDSLPIINQLMRKLVEAKYTTKHNENTLNDYVKLRQLAAFQMYKSVQLNSNSSAFKLDQNEISNALQVETQAPLLRMCNKKIVVLSRILNKNEDALENICVLLHGTTRPSMEYISKLFIQIPQSPFWKETNLKLDSKETCTIATIVDLDEIQHNVDSRIDFDVVISLKLKEKHYLLPVDSVAISALDVMGQKFDILSDYDDDVNNLILSILATSERVDLCLRHIMYSVEDIQLTPTDIFCEHLKMEKVSSIDNAVVFKNSPHHILYGLMVIFEDNINEVGSSHIKNVQVYARSPSQVLSLIHYIYDSVPYKIIITTPEYELTAKIDELSKYDEKKTFTLNYKDCALSVRNQVKIMEDHINSCMVRIKSKGIDQESNKEIDLLAQGLPEYLEFRNKLLEESLNGIKTLRFVKSALPDSDPDVMIIDD